MITICLSTIHVVYVNANKFLSDNKWEIWANSLPPVVNKYSYNRNTNSRDLKDILRTPNANIAKEYHNTQKHTSDKFQKLINVDKLRNDDTPTQSSIYKQAQGRFSGVIEGSALKKRNMYNDVYSHNKYLDELPEHTKHTHVNESDCDSNRNFFIQGTSTLHGSQWFQNQEALKESFKRGKNHDKIRGHSIGYNQNSNDSNGLATSGNIEFLKV